MNTVNDSKRLLVLETKGLDHLWPDGNSLVVCAKDKAPLRFPFRRLEAIYFIGSHDRGLAGLLSAAKADIPTFFMNGKGELKAYLISPVKESSHLRGQVEWLRLHPCGESMLTEWLDNTWRHEMSLLGSRPDTGEDPEEVETSLEREWNKVLGHEQWKQLARHLTSWQRSRTLQVFHRLKLRPESLTSIWLMEKLRPCIGSLVLLHLYVNPPAKERSGAGLYHWLSDLDGWIKERLLVWFTRLEMSIDEWSQQHG